VDAGELAGAFEAMEREAADALAGGAPEGAAGEPELAREADLRYRGQSFELTVPAGELGGLAERFHERHERRYGWRSGDAGVELVNLRLTATLPGKRPTLREAEAEGEVEPGRRRVSVDGDWQEVGVVDRAALGAGSKVEGPAVVEFAEATCVLRPGWRGTVDEAGTLVLERD
jgi:N-methylhydantoinase A